MPTTAAPLPGAARGGPVVLFLGDLNLDVRVRALAGLLAGSDVPGEISVHGGGSAANAAVWSVRSGLAGVARFAGCVGDDLVGGMLAGELRAAGVDVRVVTRQRVHSRSVAVWVAQGGERAIVSDLDTTVCLTEHDLDESWLDGVGWVHLTGYTLAAPAGRGLFRLLVRRLRDGRVPFSVDPSSAVLLARHFTPAAALAELAGAEILFPSEEEAEFLTGAGEPRVAAERLLRACRVAVVTRGAAGALVADASGVRAVRPPAVDVVDTTGAGDAFAGGFIAGYLAGGAAPAAAAAVRAAAAALATRGAR